MFVRDRLPIDLHLKEVDEKFGAFVLKPLQFPADDARVHAELLDHLPTHRVREGLPVQHLTAGKLPQPAVPLALRTLAEEKFLSVPYDGGDDVDHRCHFGRDMVDGNESNKNCRCMRIRLRSPWQYSQTDGFDAECT